ncbi:MAG: hypothetical protein QF489_09965 [Planctomycetota bacterium]|jgi:ABC-type transport system involved in cytochrome bd biosynthesis fused ATPase/permease subunit|nr:hypothetical protein [Planctomycetota bacterium]
MDAKLPPLLNDYLAYFDTNPVLAVLLGVLVVVIAVVLLRVALRLFLFFLLLLAIALLASYFIAGEEKTNKTIRRGVQEISQKAEELAEDSNEALREE